MSEPGLCSITAYGWNGELPLPGHYLMSAKGRTAFRVVEIRMPRRPGTRYVARFVCERRPPSVVTAADIVHTWTWFSRG